MQVSNLEKLLDISRQMAETRVLTPLLQFAMDVAIELTQAEYGYLVLLNDDDTLDFRVKRNTEQYTLTDEEIQVSYSIIERVIETKEPVVTADALADPMFHQAESVRALKLRSVICVPLIVHEGVIGSLYLENRSYASIFDQDNLKALRFFASQAAVSIENAILNDELEAQVTRRTAELRAANEKLSEEMAERQRMQQELIQFEVEQQRIDMLSSFIQDASHQFRTPLAVIGTSVDLLNRSIDVDQHGKYLVNIREQMQTIVRLVDSLVVMAKLDSGGLVEHQAVDLNRVLRDVQAELDPLINSKQQQLTVISDQSSVIVMADFELVALAVEHVLENAVQYSPDGSEIRVQLSLAAEYAVIEITDNGQGIAQKDLPLVFTRFFRTDKAGTTRGFGLGLAIAQKILQNYGGTIEVESQPNVGSTFRLVFNASK